VSERVPLPDLAATEALAARIAGRLRPGDVVALSGGLGAGKTTLARAVIAALGHEGEVPSPSFAIIECYDPPAVRLPLVHADFYRLEDPSEVEELGLDDYRMGAALAEWPEHAGGFPRARLPFNPVGIGGKRAHGHCRAGAGLDRARIMDLTIPMASPMASKRFWPKPAGRARRSIRCPAMPRSAAISAFAAGQATRC
jgi:tRNA threonylcarbamoyladenosine biosynthesis protein TsaE